MLIAEQDLVKTVKFSSPRYLGDPINAVKIFNGKGVDELCVLDICASKNNRGPNFDFIKDIASEAFMPLSYGGGLTNINQIMTVFRIGYEKVVLNTAFYQAPELIALAVKYAGSQSVVVSIDAKTDIFGKYRCYYRGGTEKTGKDPIEMARFAEKLGAGEILINSINNDGVMKGYDLELVRSVADAVSIPVTACGGAHDLSDIKIVLTDGKAHAAAAGSLFVYYGKEKAVLITAPSEDDLIRTGIYGQIP